MIGESLLVLENLKEARSRRRSSRDHNVHSIPLRPPLLLLAFPLQKANFPLRRKISTPTPTCTSLPILRLRMPLDRRPLVA